MKFSMAAMALLAQTAVCENVMQAREAKITAAAQLDRRAQKDQCDTGKTACGDGNGCCPRGAKCTTSKGVGVCADACYSATLFCDFGNGVNLCCQPGASCDYSQSVCTQHSTDAGGVWTSPSTSSTDGTRLPTGPVFSSTSDEESSSTATSTTTATTDSTTEETQTSQSTTDATGTGSSASSATPTKNPKDSGSAIVASWSAGVLAVVFGIMVAL